MPSNLLNHIDTNSLRKHGLLSCRCSTKVRIAHTGSGLHKQTRVPLNTSIQNTHPSPLGALRTHATNSGMTPRERGRGVIVPRQLKNATLKRIPHKDQVTPTGSHVETNESGAPPQGGCAFRGLARDPPWKTNQTVRCETSRRLTMWHPPSYIQSGLLPGEGRWADNTFVCPQLPGPLSLPLFSKV